MEVIFIDNILNTMREWLVHEQINRIFNTSFVDYSCGHRCTRLCGVECNPNTCHEKVLKKLASCDHSVTLPCYKDTADVVCTAPCNATLQCLHKCSGTCGQCKGGRMHVKCSHKCDRVLLCSHVCKDPVHPNVRLVRTNAK